MKVCFVSISRLQYSLLINKGIENIGGAELQQLMLAKELSQRDVDVSFIVGDFGQKKHLVHDGIKITKSFCPNEGIVGLGVFFPRALKLFKAMQEVDADIFLSRCAGNLVFFISFFAKILNKKYIYSMASDRDTYIRTSFLSNIRDRILYLLGLISCENIIVQNEYQLNSMKRWKSHLFKLNNIFVPELRNMQIQKDIDLLWVSRFIPIKRPHLIKQIAQKFPDKKIVIISGRKKSNSKLYENTEEELCQFSNVAFLAFVPFSDIQEYFVRAKVFINTSKQEGFPNTFLQAWAVKVPVVSMGVDPNNLISNQHFGLCSESFNRFVENIDYLLKKDTLRKRMGDMAYEYVKTHHFPNAVCKQLYIIFKGVLSK